MTLQGVIMADKAIGMPVTNPNGDKIGDVKDIVFDTTNCSLQYLVVSYNGGTTAGTTLVPIPAAALQLSSDGQSFVVADETLLSSAPHFDTNAFPYTLTMDWDKDVKTFWSTHTKPSTP
jgi:sporulation protein YlmC with PRC-barrel domain